jgi:hypothetical protein
LCPLRVFLFRSSLFACRFYNSKLGCMDELVRHYGRVKCMPLGHVIVWPARMDRGAILGRKGHG